MKGTFSDDQWMENFRMTKATSEILCGDLRPSFPDQARSVCTAMAETILDKYMKFPANDDLQHVFDGFDNTWGFPDCAGAVDCTHIPIIAQESANGDYENRKGWYSIILQAVCDHNYIITDINDGWPGFMMRGFLEIQSCITKERQMTCFHRK